MEYMMDIDATVRAFRLNEENLEKALEELWIENA